jgi:hypothetical protein
MSPTRAHRAVTGRATAIVISRHLEGVLADRTRYDNIIDLPAGIVIQDVICAPSGNHAFKRAGYPDWVVVVANEQSRAD